jgi:osmotically inducible protein OsmC
MKISKANAIWQGNLVKGSGKVKLPSTGYETSYNYLSRFENGTDTNPEELIAAAHAACFSMALSHQLSEKGFEPQEVATEARVNFDRGDSGFFIKEVVLSTRARIKGIDEKTFLTIAEDAKANCPVSKALATISISLDAKLF